MFVFEDERDNITVSIGIVMSKVCAYLSSSDDPAGFGVYTDDGESYTVPKSELERFKQTLSSYTDPHVF